MVRNLGLPNEDSTLEASRDKARTRSQASVGSSPWARPDWLSLSASRTTSRTRADTTMEPGGHWSLTYNLPETIWGRMGTGKAYLKDEDFP